MVIGYSSISLIYLLNREKNMFNNTFGLVAGVVFAMTMIGAWLTHIFHCLFAAKYLLLIAGAFIAPVGVIHGIGLWFGYAW